MTQASNTRREDVGELLRGWRRRRRMSQLELSNLADVSSRHLSFIENGRSRPSPEMILRLATELEVPLRERDTLLLAGGYAPRHREPEPDVAAVMSSFRQLLDAHIPFPAILVDRYWDLVDANEAALPLLDGVGAELLEPPINVMRLSLHPNGLAPRIKNLPAWRAYLLQQVSTRAQRTADPTLEALLAECQSYPGGGPAPVPTGPVAELQLRSSTGGPDLRVFTVASEVVMPNDVTVSELHLETFLPADDATRAIFQGQL